MNALRVVPQLLKQRGERAVLSVGVSNDVK
jgi:hypothetical protein